MVASSIALIILLLYCSSLFDVEVGVFVMLVDEIFSALTSFNLPRKSPVLLVSGSTRHGSVVPDGKVTLDVLQATLLVLLRVNQLMRDRIEDVLELVARIDLDERLVDERSAVHSSFDRTEVNNDIGIEVKLLFESFGVVSDESFALLNTIKEELVVTVFKRSSDCYCEHTNIIPKFVMQKSPQNLLRALI